jgi:hypothetical protein
VAIAVNCESAPGAGAPPLTLTDVTVAAAGVGEVGDDGVVLPHAATSAARHNERIKIIGRVFITILLLLARV